MLGRDSLVLLATLSLVLLIPTQSEALGNPNLFVSAENPQFENYFSGSMVVEVVVIDSNLRDTGSGKGEPDVTLNGNSLRMVQATDGNWYAYFANVENAKDADSTVGLAGKGLDFGVFCDRDTPESVIGVSLSETDGFALPRYAPGSTDGSSSLATCTDMPSGPILNNVVRNPKSINTNPNVMPGQIGLDPNAWPLIQLYSFSAVTIRYNPAGSPQQVSLEYDEIPNISLNLDRDLYPSNAEVFLTVNDFQLNQDPTDRDSWTFAVGDDPSTFYQAYDENGADSANGGSGLVDLSSHLSSIGFEDNGKLSVNLGSILELQPNGEQPDIDVSDGTVTYSQIITLVEDGPSSGIFDNADFRDQSTLGILSNAPRGQSGSITYNDRSISVLTGSSSATVSLNDPTLTIGDGSNSLKPGTKFPIVLVDPDQNINSESQDDLDVFRDTAIIPTLRIGAPITLEDAFDVDFFTSSTDAPNAGHSTDSSIPDRNSARLFIDAPVLTDGDFEKISLNLGISALELQSAMIDTSISNHYGTNWLNYDLRSFTNDFGISDFSDTSIELSFGSPGSLPVTIVDSGDLSAPQGLVQLDDSDVQSIFGKSGTVYLVINFDSSHDSTDVGTILNGINSQPIMVDFFSFGLVNSDDVNNAIYRFELEETSDDSSTFAGTLEYSVANQLNILDPAFIQTIHAIDDQVRFIVTGRLVADEGISVSYSDLDATGTFRPVSTKSDISTTSGVVSSDSQSYRFGQPVTLKLHDPDLNLKNDLIDVYSVIGDPSSPNVDTVGKDGSILLEVLIKDIRYKRCTVNGIEHGGLGASGFTLAETGPSTGIFEGSFKMPSKICNSSGTALISSAGGSLDAKYFDAGDDLGNPGISRLLKDKSTSYSSPPQLSAYDVVKPLSGDVREVVLSGNIDNHRRGIPLDVTIRAPDGDMQNFGAVLSSSGSYRAVISIHEDSLPGEYQIDLSYYNSHVETVLFVVSDLLIPDWVKNSAKLWSFAAIPDNEFVGALESLIEEGLVAVPPAPIPVPDQEIPIWIKISAKWWASDQISDEDFVKLIQYLLNKGIIRI